MNSFGDRSHKPAPSQPSLNSYQFDFGVAAGGRSASGSRPLRDAKPSPSPSPSPAWAHHPAPSRPSWTHQPAAAAAATGGAPTSMVGDIFGKSWASAAPSSNRVGIIHGKDPNLFSDLLGPALGAGRASANAPLKSSPAAAAPAAKGMGGSGGFPSMASMGDSLPKPAAGGPTGAAGSFGAFASFSQGGAGGGMRPMNSATDASAPMGSRKDPFGSLFEFGSKPAASPPPSSVQSSGASNDFGSFQFAHSSHTQPASQPPPAPAKSASDPLNMFFTSTVASAAPPAGAGGFGNQPDSGISDWDLGADYGGHDDGITTTELEGLPPPPAGVTVESAKAKGMVNYKNGQFADAIKWLSWAEVLIEKSGDRSAIIEVLSSRASSYKEVGEYKKAISDCSKVLEVDKENVSVLLQRALLYESSEKYRLGADDLRMVLKIDPGNRLARSTIHRLNKMAD